MSNVLALILREATDDILHALLACLPASELCLLSRVCKRWAVVAEQRLRDSCGHRGWQLPRRPRLQNRSQASMLLPWRTLYVSRSCRSCLTDAGDFAVRNYAGGAPAFYLCASCAKAPRVVARLQAMRATIDVTGLSGKPLYTKRQSKFCAEVSRESKLSIDGASGQRAELLRLGQQHASRH